MKAMIDQKIKKTHYLEDEYNKEMGAIDKQMRVLKARKGALSRKVSRMMRYRNGLIEKIKES